MEWWSYGFAPFDAIAKLEEDNEVGGKGAEEDEGEKYQGVLELANGFGGGVVYRIDGSIVPVIELVGRIESTLSTSPDIIL